MSNNPSKAALEKEVDRLHRTISDLKDRHARQLQAKTRALELARSGDLFFELGQAYPHLGDLIAWLRKAAEAGSVLHSPTGSGPTSNEILTPLDQGRSTVGDRARIEWIDRQLDRLREKIKDRMGPRGSLEDKGPQCWNPNCPTRAWHQPFDTTSCSSCGSEFSRYKPITDLTQIRVRPRCWTRGCHRYSRRYDTECPGCGAVPKTA